ncbi:MAG: ABC transporter ATP-binding protein [Thermoanaerobaculia bacterium]|nr:ABC transporter ATP-binding protein [Thermoanaerobaculia bacterium]
MKSLLPLLPYFRPYLRQLATGVSAIFATAIVGLMAPLVIGKALDSMNGDVSRETLVTYGVLLVGIAVVQGAFSFVQRLVLVTMSRHIEFDLANEFFRHLEKLHPGFYQEHRTGDLMARATNDLGAVRMVCGPAIMYGTNTFFVAAGALMFMLRIHVGLTLAALCTLPLVALATKYFGKKIHALFMSVQEYFSTLSAKVQENLAGARVVRAYTREAAEEAAFDVLNHEYVERNRHLIRWQSAFHPSLMGLVGIGFALVLGYGGHLMLAGEITVGQFVTFHLFLGKMVWPMIAIGWVINLAQRASASLARFREILEIEPAIRDEEPLVTLPEVHGAIAFEGLTFRYPTAVKPALENLRFEVPAGSTVGVVGRTGAGKSTLLSLIPRLFNPPEGTLCVDGVDVRRLPLGQLRGAIAMVPQETFLFSTTLRENIAFGRPEASDDEVREAAMLAGLGDDLEGFPKGLETMVGERGITLSGGQKQRVALARALLRRPQILLLDDCLSAVDTHTEEKILRNLRTFFPGRTVFLVSHRISAVQAADLVVVLDHGRICELGTHAQLLAHDGIYADLYQRQQLEEELAVV